MIPATPPRPGRSPSIEVTTERHRADWGRPQSCFGDVLVTRQVVSYARRSAETGLLIGEDVLDLPERRLPTRAVWWTICAGAARRAGRAGIDLPGAAHAAEHASIGLLPLVAACDRWDVGGVSADLHPATGKLTVFVYDGHAGGAGFAERGFAAAGAWLYGDRRCDCQLRMRSRAARRAFSHPNAGMATTRWLSTARSRCCAACWPAHRETGSVTAARTDRHRCES